MPIQPLCFIHSLSTIVLRISPNSAQVFHRFSATYPQIALTAFRSQAIAEAGTQYRQLGFQSRYPHAEGPRLAHAESGGSSWWLSHGHPSGNREKATNNHCLPRRQFDESSGASLPPFPGQPVSPQRQQAFLAGKRRLPIAVKPSLEFQPRPAIAHEIRGSRLKAGKGHFSASISYDRNPPRQFRRFEKEFAGEHADIVRAVPFRRE